MRPLNDAYPTQSRNRPNRYLVRFGTVNIVLLTWNPDKFFVSDRQWNREIRQIQDCGFLYAQWSTGNNRKTIKPDDVAFLLRQGRDRGIVAKGIITTDVFQEPTWEEDVDEDALKNYAEVTWTSMVPIEKRLTIETLKTTFPNASWSPFASGTTVDPLIHEQLLAIWDQTVHASGLSYPHQSNVRRTLRASNTLIEHQNGSCYACKIDSNAMYQTAPTQLLSSYRGPGDNAEVALCPNCLTVATANGAHLSIAELEQRIAITF